MSELILLINHLFDDKPFVSTVLMYDSLLINIYIHSITLEQDEAKVLVTIHFHLVFIKEHKTCFTFDFLKASPKDIL